MYLVNNIIMKTSKKTSSKGTQNPFAATAAPAMQAINYQKALSLAMQGNLWYKHVDVRTGVTSDPDTSERTCWDVLTASTKSPGHMLAQGYTQVTGKHYAALLHTFLKLVETHCSGKAEDWMAIQYNRKVYLNG